MGDDFGYKRDPENGMLVGPDGCHYENVHKLYHHALLGLCGCGSPEDVYNFLRSVLACFDRRGARGENWVNAEAEIAVLISANPDMAAHAFSHLLSHLNLTEHGGSVGGSWLTKDGEKIVDLRPAREDEYDDA